MRRSTERPSTWASPSSSRPSNELGVTFFDAAEAYGPHEVERILGEAIVPFRDKVAITSKFGWNIDLETGERRPGLNSRPAHITAVVDGMLKRLRTDRIDLLYQPKAQWPRRTLLLPSRMCSKTHKVLALATEGYSVWGSSAGARLAAAIGSHGVARFGGDDLPKPSAVVMAYTGHSEYSTMEPSAFVVGGERDGIAPPSVMKRRVQALRKLGTDVEFHRFRDLGHGFGPGIGTTAEGWLDRAVRFWEKAIELNETWVR